MTLLIHILVPFRLAVELPHLLIEFSGKLLGVSLLSQTLHDEGHAENQEHHCTDDGQQQLTQDVLRDGPDVGADHVHGNESEAGGYPYPKRTSLNAIHNDKNKSLVADFRTEDKKEAGDEPTPEALSTT